MITTTQKVREVFNISADVPESKISRAISEAEKIDVRDCLGVDILSKLLTDQEFLNKYKPETEVCAGLEMAVCYLAFSRYLENSSITNTAAGAKIQQILNSSEADDKTKSANIRNNREKGYSILNQIKAQMCADSVEVKKTNSSPFNFYI